MSYWTDGRADKEIYRGTSLHDFKALFSLEAEDLYRHLPRPHGAEAADNLQPLQVPGQGCQYAGDHLSLSKRVFGNLAPF